MSGIAEQAVKLPSHPRMAAAATRLDESMALADEIADELQALMEADEAVGAGAPYCPIAYGSVAFNLRKGKQQTAPSNEDHSHRWTVYVRGADGRDISYAIKKVVFTFHPSITPSVREITSHPFEVTETGWGEFDIKIAIHTHDPTSAPIQIVHHLRLYHGPSVSSANAERPVISEFYDEVVFNDVERLHPEARARLLAGPGARPPDHPFTHLWSEFSAESDLAQLAAAHAFVAQETARLAERFARGEESAASLDEDLEALGWPHGKRGYNNTRAGPTVNAAEAAAAARDTAAGAVRGAAAAAAAAGGGARVAGARGSR